MLVRKVDPEVLQPSGPHALLDGHLDAKESLSRSRAVPRGAGSATSRVQSAITSRSDTTPWGVSPGARATNRGEPRVRKRLHRVVRARPRLDEAGSPRRPGPPGRGRGPGRSTQYAARRDPSEWPSARLAENDYCVDAAADHRTLGLTQRGVLRDGDHAGAHEVPHRRVEAAVREPSAAASGEAGMTVCDGMGRPYAQHDTRAIGSGPHPRRGNHGAGAGRGKAAAGLRSRTDGGSAGAR